MVQFRTSIRTAAVGLGLCVLFTGGILPLQAAFKQVPLEELVQSTDEVVVVRVLEHDQVMDWMEGVADLVPYQRLRCEVLHCMKGSRRVHSELTFFVPGGELPNGGHFTLSTAPAVEAYLEGETVLFLNQGSRYAPSGQLGLNAGDHGIFQTTKRKGVPFVRRKDGSPIPRTVAMEQFQAVVLEVVAREKAAKLKAEEAK